MSFGWTLAKLALAYQVGVTTREIHERHKYWRQARDYADYVGKPLLVVGMKRHAWEPSNGDVTIDLDPAVAQIEGGLVADERQIPFNDKTFGAVYNAHTLEHLATAEDVELAVNECVRVAERAVFLCPDPLNFVSHMLCPSHNLRLWFDQTNNRITVTDNGFRTGLGWSSGGEAINAMNWERRPRNPAAQSLITDTMPEIRRKSVAYVL